MDIFNFKNTKEEYGNLLVEEEITIKEEMEADHLNFINSNSPTTDPEDIAFNSQAVEIIYTEHEGFLVKDFNKNQFSPELLTLNRLKRERANQVQERVPNEAKRKKNISKHEDHTTTQVEKETAVNAEMHYFLGSDKRLNLLSNGNTMSVIFECPGCRFQTADKIVLLEHCKCMHEKTKQSEATKSCETIYKNDECGFVTVEASESTYLSEINNYFDDTKIKDSILSENSPAENHLDENTSLTNGCHDKDGKTAVFVCKICEFKFTTKSGRLKHCELTHHGENYQSKAKKYFFVGLEEKENIVSTEGEHISDKEIKLEEFQIEHVCHFRAPTESAHFGQYKSAHDEYDQAEVKKSVEIVYNTEDSGFAVVEMNAKAKQYKLTDSANSKFNGNDFVEIIYKKRESGLAVVSVKEEIQPEEILGEKNNDIN